MQSNILYARKTFNLAIGNKATTEVVTLPQGTCVGVYIIPIKNKNPEQIIEVGVQNSQNGDIITATDFRDYAHKGGGYFEGVKQLSYPTENQQFYINVNADEAVTEDTKFQMVFIIKLPCNEDKAMGCPDNPYCTCNQ